MRIYLLLFHVFMILGAVTNIPLLVELTEVTSSSRSTLLPCCIGSDIMYCKQARLNPRAVGAQHIELPGLNGSLSYAGLVGDSKDTYHYKNNDIDAVINYDKDSKGIHGDVSTSMGEFYYLEFCGGNRHTMKRMNVASINKKKCILLESRQSLKRSLDSSIELSYKNQIDHLKLIKPELSRSFYDKNGGTMAQTLSVNIYYTPEFFASTPDINGYMKQLVDKTNQGYKNSGVKTRVKVFCTEMTTFHEKNNLKSQIYEFAVMKNRLINTADAAVLFVRDDPVACGVVLSYRLNHGQRIAGVSKACAIENQAFAHQLGHLLGLGHDKANANVNKDSIYKDGHGHLLNRGKALGSRGFHTIMAYPSSQHQQVINYYSNPRVIFPETGTPTGVRGISYNTRWLASNSFMLAAKGDESGNCINQQRLSPTCIAYGKQLRIKKKLVTPTHNLGRLKLPDMCESVCRNDPHCLSYAPKPISGKCYQIRMQSYPDSFSSWGPLTNVRCAGVVFRAKSQITKPKEVYSFTSYKTEDCHEKCILATGSQKCFKWTYQTRTKKCKFFRFS